jgi:hypothetical protein
MKPIITEKTNITLVGEGCGDLPARAGEVDGESVIETVWALDQDDLEALMETRRFYLTVYGSAHPPIALTVESLLGNATAD